MNILVIGRTIPEKKTGMMGTFEFEQAVAVNSVNNNVIYTFCDLRSVKWIRKFGFVNFEREKVNVHGCFFPIGGIPSKLIRTFRGFSFVKLLKKIIANEGTPDIIHIHYPLLTINREIWGLLKSLNIPIVVTEHWSKVQTKELILHEVEFLKTIVEESQCFICVGGKLKQSVIELTNTQKNITIIPNMVSTIFNYDEKRKKSHLFEFIAIGRLVESKRIDLVIRAFAQAFPNDKNVHLTIVGDGVVYKELKKMIEELNMSDQISMLGFLSREKTAEALKKSNVFVSASILETFGVPVIEAMSCGKPVIIAENSPIKEYINIERGLLFEVDNIASLEDTMKRMYEYRFDKNSNGIADFANRHFSKTAIVEKLCSIYGSCINTQVNKG